MDRWVLTILIPTRILWNMQQYGSTFVNTSPTCYISFQYSIYSNMNEADARPAHVAQQKLGHCVIAHIKG
jgi:hypothetical protein